MLTPRKKKKQRTAVIYNFRKPTKEVSATGMGKEPIAILVHQKLRMDDGILPAPSSAFMEDFHVEEAQMLWFLLVSATEFLNMVWRRRSRVQQIYVVAPNGDIEKSLFFFFDATTLSHRAFLKNVYPNNSKNCVSAVHLHA